MKAKVITMLMLLMAAVTGAWADKKIEFKQNLTVSTTLNVTSETEINIDDGVIVTFDDGIVIESGAMLTVNGPGKLVVNGRAGEEGATGGTAISGNITVKGGATVEANGGNGGNGSSGSNGNDAGIVGMGETVGDGDKGGNGGQGGIAISGTVIIHSGTIIAKGGNGGEGGMGGNGGTNHINSEMGLAGSGGDGGNGGNAFEGSLTFYDGNVTAIGGKGGSGGNGGSGRRPDNGGHDGPNGHDSRVYESTHGGHGMGSSGRAGADGNAFADNYSLTLGNTDAKVYADADYSNRITNLVDIVNYNNVYIVIPVPDFTLTPVNTDHCTVKFYLGENEVTGANEGDDVTVVITPNEGWTIGTATAYAYTNWARARHMELESPDMDVLDEITMIPVDNVTNTWTFKMPAANVKVGPKYVPRFVWKQGETTLADGASVTYCVGFPFTSPVLDNPDNLNLNYDYSVNNVNIDANGKLTVINNEAGNFYKTNVNFNGNDTYVAKEHLIGINVVAPTTLTVTPNDHGTVTVEGLDRPAITSTDLGKVICTDGSIYATVSEAGNASKTPVAMIVGIDTQNNKGLAIALQEEGNSLLEWQEANTICINMNTSKPVTGGTWSLPSIAQWKAMFKTFGGDESIHNTLDMALYTAGGDKLTLSGINDTSTYWSTENNETQADYVSCTNSDGSNVTYYIADKSNNYLLRPFLTFDLRATNVIATTTAGKYSVIPGTSVTLKAKPAEGYKLQGWSNNVTVNQDGTASLTLNGAATVTATFIGKPYIVTLDDGGVDTDNWTGKAGETTTGSPFPITAKTGEAVTLTYNGELKVKRVTAEIVIDLSALTADDLTNGAYIVPDGRTLSGTLNGNIKIVIPDGATVTLGGVTINGLNSNLHPWAGITCEGNATIILKDGTTNTVTGFSNGYPGILAGPSGKTLTIKGGTLGTGKLTATGRGLAAGIGSGSNTDCGDITISGGSVTATGGANAAGIGSSYLTSCGAINITSNVTSVTATKGTNADNSIGKGNGGSCGKVTIGSTEYWSGTAYVGDGANYLSQATIYYPFIPITNFSINIDLGDTEELFTLYISNIEPGNASNQTFTWSVVEGNAIEIVSIDGDTKSCQMNAKSDGKTKVRATANDGSNEYREIEINVDTYHYQPGWDD